MFFIQQEQDNNIFIYREQLKSNVLRGDYYFRFEMKRLQAFDEQLCQSFKNNPQEYSKSFERAVEIVYQNVIYDESEEMEKTARFQVQVHSDENPKMLRELQSDSIGKLVCIPGIITSTSRTNIRARKAVFKCNKCGHEKTIEVPFGLYRV